MSTEIIDRRHEKDDTLLSTDLKAGEWAIIVDTQDCAHTSMNHVFIGELVRMCESGDRSRNVLIRARTGYHLIAVYKVRRVNVEISIFSGENG